MSADVGGGEGRAVAAAGLEVDVFGTRFQNPVLLAAGTCGFGEELRSVIDLEELGGFVTKSVTLEARVGNPAPRVSELEGAMLNSIGLANPGLAAVRAEKLPWIAANVRKARVFVSVAGHVPDEYFRIVEVLDGQDGFVGFELNLSCPNDTRLGGLPFALDPDALAEVVGGARERTQRPLLVKLAPTVPDIGAVAAAAADAGADGVTLVNTMPALDIDPETRLARLGAGPGGMSGPALRAVGVHAVWRARQRTSVPLVGVGGVTSSNDALQYLLAGASLVQVGTSSFADPRTARRVISGLRRYVADHGIGSVGEIVGAYPGSAGVAGRPRETVRG